MFSLQEQALWSCTAELYLLQPSPRRWDSEDSEDCASTQGSNIFLMPIKRTLNTCPQMTLEENPYYSLSYQEFETCFKQNKHKVNSAEGLMCSTRSLNSPECHLCIKFKTLLCIQVMDLIWPKHPLGRWLYPTIHFRWSTTKKYRTSTMMNQGA